MPQNNHQKIQSTSQQLHLETHVGNIITVDGLKFKDLNGNGRLDPYEDWRLPVADRVDDLISKLTIEEKVGLMLYGNLEIGPEGDVVETPGFFDPGTTESIRERHIRHFLIFDTIAPEKQADWSNRIQKIAEESRMGIPVNIASDPRHHLSPYNDLPSKSDIHHSMWPQPIGLAAAGDTELVKTFGQYAAREYRAMGICTALHPVADLATEPRWPRIYATFGEEAGLVSDMAAAYIRGFQGKKLTSAGVACMTKHWPGGGPQEDGYDPHNSYGKRQVYPGGNFDHHRIPFTAALASGTAAVMSYYGIAEGIDTVGMGFSEHIIDYLLRRGEDYNGIVCTDWRIVNDNEIVGMPWGVEDLTVEERHERVIRAGSDQFGGAGDPAPILNLVRCGKVSEDRIDASLRRILKVMFQLGLFENPYLDPAESASIVGGRQIKEAALKAQHKSVVLLKNSADVLPLPPTARLYIPTTTMPHHDTPGVYIDKPMLDLGAAAAVAALAADPADADAAVVMVSAPFQWTLPITEFQPFRFHEGPLVYEGAENEAHLKVINETVAAMGGRPVIVVMHMDRPAVLSEFIDAVDGMLATFGITEKALFDVIFGKVAPTGKLPFDLPADMAQVEKQKEDLPFDFGAPLFRFGHGLSY